MILLNFPFFPLSKLTQVGEIQGRLRNGLYEWSALLPSITAILQATVRIV
jgi:hypothetical protein